MSEYNLGKLIHVDPKSVWKHEALNFTPWLAENVGLLGECLGIELEIEDREVQVGDFAVDLVGKEVGTGRKVIIENQLTPTNHGHLGQLMTYAAGLEATVVVWVSPQFRPEHAKAVNWLNDRTLDALQFYAVQLELVQIGDSLKAPLFTLVAQPSNPANGTDSPVTQGKSKRQQAYHDFFSDLLTRLKSTSPAYTTTSRVGYDSWLGFSAGRAGFSYSVSFTSGGNFRVELTLGIGDQAANKSAFDTFYTMSAELASDLGTELIWQRLDNRQASRICIERPGNIFSPDELLDQLKSWGVQFLIRFREVFTPRLKTLVIATPPNLVSAIDMEGLTEEIQ